jgi:hypothetical protein
MCVAASVGSAKGVGICQVSMQKEWAYVRFQCERQQAQVRKLEQSLNEIPPPRTIPTPP